MLADSIAEDETSEFTRGELASMMLDRCMWGMWGMWGMWECLRMLWDGGYLGFLGASCRQMSKSGEANISD